MKNYRITFSAFANGMNSEVDEGILPYKYAKLCYNYKISNGALKDGIGFEALTLPTSYANLSNQRTISLSNNQEIKAMWLFRYYDSTLGDNNYMLLYYNTAGKIKYIPLIAEHPYDFEIASIIYSAGVPNALNYRLNGTDYMIFSSCTDGMWKYTPTQMAQQVENGPSIASMCLHYERMFAIVESAERNRLCFSENLDPTNFNPSLSEGGFIDMQDERGKLNKVVSFNDYVYVFRDFGVSRVSAYGDQTTFSVSHLFVSSSKIYGNSVCVCGDKILLLARDGIYSFNGYTTTKLSLGIETLLKDINNENCSALYHDGKYYLALKLDFQDNQSVGCENYTNGYVNNALIELDLKTGDIMITRGIDICNMLLLDDGKFCKVLACFNGEYKHTIGQMTNDGKFFGNALKKCWTTPKSNLGYPTQVKMIKEVFVKTKSPCDVKISTEKTSKTYSLKGMNKAQRLKTNIHGEQVEISFISNTNDPTEISCPQIVIGVTS